MKRFRNVLRLVLCFSVLAVALNVPTSAADPPPTFNVDVVNTASNPVPVTLQGTGSVSGSVTVTNTTANPVPVSGNVAVTNTAANPVPVNVGNFPASTALKPSQFVTLENSRDLPGNCPSGGGILVDQVTSPGGTTSTFSIPSGEVLVITAAEAQ